MGNDSDLLALIAGSFIAGMLVGSYTMQILLAIGVVH